MVDASHAEGAWLEGRLPIPVEGLEEVLRAWSGRGQLLEALAAVDDTGGTDTSRAWSAVDVRRRGHRVLFARLQQSLLAWPSSESIWLEALPADVDRERFTAPAPRAGVSWRETRRRHGWPPVAFSGRTKSRVADNLMARTFAWTVERLDEVIADAVALEPTAAHFVGDRIAVAQGVRCRPPLSATVGVQPEASDLTSLSREGRPWSALVAVAEELRAAERSLSYLAREVLYPDEDLRPRLFQLAILGMILHACRTVGCEVTSLEPLSRTRSGPSYRIVDPAARAWDLWFEAGGAWAHYKSTSPYAQVVSALGGRASNLSPDLALVLPGTQALIVECKYSAAADYVGRGGLTQAMAYAVDYRTSLTPEVLTVVVAPQGVVVAPRSTETFVGRLGLDAPSGLAALVSQLLTTPS